ncbi:response regulator [Dactylosporangium sp. McL0621]|uniref:response regulator n=1 Tax=Dactylosporangium sp. McL0621 TaxID=3415678 RepID=UPI003CF3E32A
MTRPIKVLIADDHPIVREGLRLVLERRGDLEVVGEAADGRAAIQLATQFRPDVAIVDLDMPQLNGARVIAELARHLPSCRCLVLTMHEDDAHLSDALAAGAAGFLVKGAGSADIERAVRAAAAGQMVLAPEIGPRVARAMAASRPTRGGEAFADLTERELDLLELLAEGADNQTISRALHLAPKTVRNQVSALLDRIGAPDRAAAGQAARTAGLRRHRN